MRDEDGSRGCLIDDPPLELLTVRKGRAGILHVELEGELDLAAAAAFEVELLHMVVARRAPTVLDLRKLAFLDLAGLRVLGRTMQAIEREGMTSCCLIADSPTTELLFAHVEKRRYALPRTTSLEIAIEVVSGEREGARP